MKTSHDVIICGCCEGIEAVTPQPTTNRPGLDALRYRVGTYGSFLETMQARLSTLCLGSAEESAAEAGLFPLRSLTTRAADDATIALLHGWATVGDVLTFYQERIANEGYLRTATERLSILELARLVGYRLRPGVSASVYLAFSLQDGYEVEIAAGTRAQSLPAPGELPQPFETAEPLSARAEWNAIRPRQMQPQKITYELGYDEANPDSVSPYDVRRLEWIDFAGAETGLQANDPLLFVFGANPTTVVRRVLAIEPQRAAGRTRVTLYRPPSPEPRTREMAVSRVADVAARYRRVEDFNVSTERVMAQRVLAELEALEETVSPQMSERALTAELNRRLSTLEQEHVAAVEGGYSILEPWVGGLVRELGAIRDESAWRERRERRMAAVSSLEHNEAGYDNGQPPLPPALQALRGHLSSLAESPSVPPANAWLRPQNVNQTLGASGDIAPKLLVNLSPELKRHTYAFWSGVAIPATTYNHPETVSAMRVQAAPFGHNAPLKPVYDNGRVVDYEEWPLIAIQAGLRLSRATGGVIGAAHFNTPLNAALSVKRGGARQLAEEELDTSRTDPIQRSLLGVNVTLTPDFTDPVEGGSVLIGLTYQVVEQQLKLSISHGVLNVNVVSTGETLELAQSGNSTVRDPFTGTTIRVSRVDERGEITVTVETTAYPLDEQLLSELEHEIALDAVYEDIAPGSWAIIERTDTGAQVVRRVNQVQTVSMAAYGVTGKVTKVILESAAGDHWLTEDDVTLAAFRNTTIYAGSEALALAEIPVEEVVDHDLDANAVCPSEPAAGTKQDRWRRYLKPVSSDNLLLDGLYDGLEAGRWAIVQGERLDLPGVVDAELVMLSNVEQHLDPGLPGDTPHTLLTLAQPLAYCYRRDTVTVYGNVAKATHGETRREALGSGDGSQAWQTFALKQSPLTFLAAATPEGAASKLEVRVNDVLWREAGNLFTAGANDRVYVLSTDDDDVTSVRFGDGRHGARLPTGIENARAVYRSATGKVGNVAAEQISLLATRPLGVKGVINPLPATGGADRESRDTARQNAPLGVMALDRLVSVQDYADFARSFAGIGKAGAVRLSDGRRRLVHVTITGADDVPIALTSDLYRMLVQALHDYGDPYQPLQVALRDLKLLVIVARVRVQPEYEWETVGPWVKQALQDTFSFHRRQLGQDVYRSEVLAAVQAVRGVDYVDVDALGAIAESEVTADLQTLVAKLDDIVAQAGTERPVSWVPVDMARIDESGRIRSAQLAYLSPDVPETLILEEIT